MFTNLNLNTTALNQHNNSRRQPTPNRTPLTDITSTQLNQARNIKWLNSSADDIEEDDNEADIYPFEGKILFLPSLSHHI